VCLIAVHALSSLVAIAPAIVSRADVPSGCSLLGTDLHAPANGQRLQSSEGPLTAMSNNLRAAEHPRAARFSTFGIFEPQSRRDVHGQGRGGRACRP
jgi:hypothetical protein